LSSTHRENTGKFDCTGGNALGGVSEKGYQKARARDANTDEREEGLQKQDERSADKPTKTSSGN